MPTEVLNTLFSLIDPIYDLHLRILREVEQRVTTWENCLAVQQQHLGCILLSNMDLILVRKNNVFETKSLTVSNFHYFILCFFFLVCSNYMDDILMNIILSWKALTMLSVRIHTLNKFIEILNCRKFVTCLLLPLS